MEYNINYCIISLIYLSITAFFYRHQARIPSLRSSLFDAMLLCGILSIGLDIVAAAIDPYAYRYPAWSIYVINIIFLSTIQASGVLMYFYTINLTGTFQRMCRWKRILSLLPFVIVVSLIASSPFTQKGAFYLDSNNVYHHGAMHMALYVTMGLYLITSFVIVLFRRRRLQSLKCYTILAFLLVTITAMLIQMEHPYLLVNTTANALSLTLMYHILEAPSNHVDALTGVLNRSALSPVLRDLFETGTRCTMLVYSLDALHLVNHSFGMHGGDAALIAFAQYLQKEYPRQQVLRVEGDVFCVVMTGGAYLDFDQLERIYQGTRRTFEIQTAEVALDSSLGCINSEDCSTVEEMTAMLESILSMHRVGVNEHVLLADTAYQRARLQQEAIERATERALDENRVEVYFQPIHNAAGKLCAAEALVRIHDPELGFLPPQELVELAERNGDILRLGEQVLRRTCEFLRDYGVAQWGLDHIGVNLSAIQCVRPELPGEVAQILEEYGIAPGLIAFEVTETAAGALATVRENMERLVEEKTHFLLDDFGTGYANFKNMAALPYHCIKIDKSLLWNAQESTSTMRLLSGIVKVIHTLHLASLCEGVETKQQVELLQELGVSMLQGYYFSKPIPPERFVEYARKEGMCI